MADLPSSKRTAVTTAPSQTSYQSMSASGSHLNIIAKSNEIMLTEARIVIRCKSQSCTCGAAYFPKAASPAVTIRETASLAIPRVNPKRVPQNFLTRADHTHAGGDDRRSYNRCNRVVV